MFTLGTEKKSERECKLKNNNKWRMFFLNFFWIDCVENRDEIREGDNGDEDADSSADHDGLFSPLSFF